MAAAFIFKGFKYVPKVIGAFTEGITRRSINSGTIQARLPDRLGGGTKTFADTEEGFKSAVNWRQDNIKDLLGDKKILTDDFLKKLYEDSKVTLVPLKNSIQPSGQSVSLQSISMKTPVIITKTDGFWDTEFFENKKNIFFAQNNSIEEWQSLLNELLSSDNIYSDIQSAGRNLIVEKFDVQNFNKRLHELLED